MAGGTALGSSRRRRRFPRSGSALVTLLVLATTPLPAPLDVPEIDDRSFQDLVAEARSRIPVHVPEWTDFDSSDPGVTLLDFFDLVKDRALHELGRELLDLARARQALASLDEDETIRLLVGVILRGAIALKPDAPPAWSDFSRLEDSDLEPVLRRVRLTVIGSTFRRGDRNGDGRFDIADAIGILDTLFRLGGPSPCEDAADVNDDGTLDISDAVFLLSHQFLGGPPPPSPFPECGEDLTDDRLTCELYRECPPVR